MSKILAIALNTFREAVRNRVLYVLLFFAVIVMAGAWIASTLSLGAEAKVVRDLGIGAVNVIAVLMAIFVGVGLVYNDLDKKTIYTIIPKPIYRWQFIVGKYLGLLGTIVVNILIMTFFFCTVLYLRESMSEDMLTKNFYVNAAGKPANPGNAALVVYAATCTVASMGKGLLTVLTWGAYGGGSSVIVGIMPATLLTILETMLVTAFALLFSTFSSPTLSAFLTVAVFMIGRLNADLYDFTNSTWQRIVEAAGGEQFVSASQTLVHRISLSASYLAPNLNLFNESEALTNMKEIAVQPQVVAYAAVYTIMVLTITVMIFNRRNFK